MTPNTPIITTIGELSDDAIEALAQLLIDNFAQEINMENLQHGL